MRTGTALLGAVLGILCGSGAIREAGAGSIQVHGQLSSTARPEVPALGLNESNRGETPYDLLDLDLFLQSAPSPRVRIQTWLVLNDVYPNGFALGSAYVLYEALDRGRLFLEAGKIPTAFGTYIERFSSARGPLIGTPLLYFHHGGVVTDRVPAGADDLLAVRGQGQLGSVTYPGQHPSSSRGLAVLYAACYDVGFAALGSSGSIEYRAALTSGVQGAPTYKRPRNDSQTVTARIGWSPGPSVRLGISGSTGAYLSESLETSLPPGKTIGGTRQEVIGADLELATRRWTVYLEAARSRLGSPFVDEPLDMTGWFLEVQRRLGPGLTVGMRWEELIFSTIEASDGRTARWDVSRRRLESALGYGLSRSVNLRASWQLNHAGVGGFDPGRNLVALQLLTRF